MNDAWMELHGEYPESESDKYCPDCEHELYKGDCVYNDCPNQTRAYCHECGDLFDIDEVCYIPSEKFFYCHLCYQNFLSGE
jgi:hypothetical protein